MPECRETAPAAELTVGQTIVRQRAQLEGQDVLLRGLRGCKVFLLGSMAALRQLDVQDCTVCSGPVTGATFVDGTPLQNFHRHAWQPARSST